MTEQIYDAEYRRMAVQLALSQKNKSEVARQLGIPRTKLRGWVRSYEKMIAKGESKEMWDQLKAELTQKDRKISALEEELEILKKAAAYFAKSL